MTRYTKSIAIFAVFAGAALACTANVENPQLNQAGSSSTVAMCTMTCDGTETSCAARCSDDTCKATCTTTHGQCVTQCDGTTTTGDGG